MPANTSGTLSATGSITLSKNTSASFATFGISGTYGTVTFVFEGSSDGTNYFPLAAIAAQTDTLVTGTIAPSDNTTRSWFVPCLNLQTVRLRVTAIASGTLSVYAAADELLAGGANCLGPIVTPATVPPVPDVYAIDSAITTKDGIAMLTKATAGAYTLAAPTSGTDDGKRLRVISTTAAAHTLTQTTPGFNNGSTASDVGTFGAAIGNSIELVAYGGVWYTVGTPRGVTLA